MPTGKPRETNLMQITQHREQRYRPRKSTREQPSHTLFSAHIHDLQSNVQKSKRVHATLYYKVVGYQRDVPSKSFCSTAEDMPRDAAAPPTNGP